MSESAGDKGRERDTVPAPDPHACCKMVSMAEAIRQEAEERRNMAQTYDPFSVLSGG